MPDMYALYAGEGSFLWQCLKLFGDEGGHLVWEAVNGWFDTLPLAATIDQSIFCVHGGMIKCVCLMCVPYVYALYVCLMCMPYVHALCVCLMCMPYVYALCACFMCMP